MSFIQDDIRLVAPGPDAVPGLTAQIVGAPGLAEYWYWVVAHYPIGISIAGPIQVGRAPDELSATDYVRVSWEKAIGATQYDVLRTDTARLPGGSEPYALAIGIGDTSYNDQGAPLTTYSIAALVYGAPATRGIHLNNRDYDEPTLELPAQIRVTNIVFQDGTEQSSAGGGGGSTVLQTPWTADIDGGGFALNNAGDISLSDRLTITEKVGGTGFSDIVLNSVTGVIRWSFGKGSLPAATGGNTGDEFKLAAYADDGSFLDAIFSVHREGQRQWVFYSPVGIGTSKEVPGFSLDVEGDINCTGAFRINGIPIGGGAGSQTPWTSDIDAAGHTLKKLARLEFETADAIQVTSYQNPAGLSRWGVGSTFPPEAGADSGSDFGWWRYSDSGGFIGHVMRMMRATGFVGIGATFGSVPPTHHLDLETDDAAKPATNTWTVASDLRLKMASEVYTQGLETVRQLTPMRARYNGKNHTPLGLEVIGFNAQDLMALEPSWVKATPGTIDGKETEVFNVNTGPLVYMLLNAIKELDTRLKAVEVKP